MSITYNTSTYAHTIISVYMIIPSRQWSFPSCRGTRSQSRCSSKSGPTRDKPRFRGVNRKHVSTTYEPKS
eukprot:8954212-Pyramimonas_sp.AAC.1